MPIRLCQGLRPPRRAALIPPEIARLGGLLDRDLAAEGLVVAEGGLLVERLLSRPEFRPLAVLALPGASERIRGLLPADCPLFELSEGELSDFAGFRFHRGILALARRPAPRGVPGTLTLLAARGLPPLLVLPETRDPENLGALARSASAFGFGALLLGPRCPDPLSRRALRVSMGALLELPVASLEGPGDWAAFRGAGYEGTAALLDPGAVELGEWRPSGPSALFLGAEYEGLGPDWLALCAGRVRIDMAPGPDSLNVAAAGAVLMRRVFETRRG